MKRLLISMITGIFLVSCFLILKYYFSQNVPSSYGISGAKQLMVIDNLFLGSSAFRQGLDINLLEEELGDSVYILCYNGNQPIMMEKELKYLLDKGVQINHLHIDMLFSYLSSTPKISDKRILWELDFNSIYKLYEIIDSSSKMNISDKYKYFVLSNNEFLITYPISYNLIKQRYYKGGSPHLLAGVTDEEIAKLSFDDYEFEINEYQVQAILNIIELAEENNIDIDFVEVPKHQKINESSKYKAAITAYRELLEETDIAYYSNLTNDEFSNTSINFSDLYHLSNVGAELYTHLLSESLLVNK